MEFFNSPPECSIADVPGACFNLPPSRDMLFGVLSLFPASLPFGVLMASISLLPVHPYVYPGFSPDAFHALFLAFLSRRAVMISLCLCDRDPRPLPRAYLRFTRVTVASSLRSYFSFSRPSFFLILTSCIAPLSVRCNLLQWYCLSLLSRGRYGPQRSEAALVVSSQYHPIVKTIIAAQ